MKKVAILGSGQVGDALAKGFLANGHPVMRGSRDPSKLEAWKKAASGEASIGTFADAAKWGEIIVLAVKGSGAESAIEAAGPANFAGKTVIDATNPLSDEPPQNGCLRYFTNANESLMERLQAKAPQGKFVKAFNSVGNTYFYKPSFKQQPTMFICGNDTEAKQETSEILSQFGWVAADMGALEVARPIEALCQLWCAPGFARNEWTHAFGLIKA